MEPATHAVELSFDDREELRLLYQVSASDITFVSSSSGPSRTKVSHFKQPWSWSHMRS